MIEINLCSPEELHFDLQNPRLVTQPQIKDEEQVLNILWMDMNVKELVTSIVASGFFKTEALYVVEEDGKKVVVEGNRRLAAVKAILHPELIKSGAMSVFEDKITPELRTQLQEGIPVIYSQSREATWRYIGFKHVNGAVKWDSLAKAKYIAQVHNEYGVSIDKIAEQIGDSHRTTVKLYQGLMVLEQAEKETEFRIDDIAGKKLYFSHLYTALTYEGYQKFLSLDPENISPNPIPQSALKNLQELMYWMYGSKSKTIRPLIEHQNPDLRYLESALRNVDSIEMLRAGFPLVQAYDNSLDALQVLHQSIVSARNQIQIAMSKMASYNGDKTIFDAAETLASNAIALRNFIRSTFLKQHEEDGL